MLPAFLVEQDVGHIVYANVNQNSNKNDKVDMLKFREFSVNKENLFKSLFKKY